GAAVVFRIPDRYEASARIYVDTQSILKPLMAGLTVQPNVEQQVVMLSRTLISRPNVEKLIRMADLDLGAQSKDAQAELVERLTKTLQIKSSARDNLYTLSYQDSEPAKAKRVIQSLVSIFVESSLGDSRKDSAVAKRFLDEQIKGYENKLEEAELRLKNFKLKNLEMQGTDGRDSVSRLADLSTLLNQSRLELSEAENARNAAVKQLQEMKADAANSSIAGILQESALVVTTPEVNARIAAIQQNLDTLLQRYTDQHPDVVGSRRLLKEMEAQKQRETAEQRRLAMGTSTASIGGGAGTNNLAYQEISRLLAAAQIQVAGLQARVAEYVSRYDRARSQMKTTPQTEAEFTQLNRDYAIHKKNYDDLVGRRESAALSGDLESSAGVADFRLIDPPQVSAGPVAPNRTLLLPLALVVGIVSGLFVAFASSQLRPVFHDSRSLRTLVGLPLLGVVTKVMNDATLRRRRADLRRFVAASSGLVGLFIAGIVLLTFFSRPA
ncbi:MAG: XrtA system polysaccharide chain length determinant, partial [Burkholderiales bacterium]